MGNMYIAQDYVVDVNLCLLMCGYTVLKAHLVFILPLLFVAPRGRYNSRGESCVVVGPGAPERLCKVQCPHLGSNVHSRAGAGPCDGAARTRYS